MIILNVFPVGETLILTTGRLRALAMPTKALVGITISGHFADMNLLSSNGKMLNEAVRMLLTCDDFKKADFGSFTIHSRLDSFELNEPFPCFEEMRLAVIDLSQIRLTDSFIIRKLTLSWDALDDKRSFRNKFYTDSAEIVQQCPNLTYFSFRDCSFSSETNCEDMNLLLSSLVRHSSLLRFCFRCPDELTHLEILILEEACNKMLVDLDFGGEQKPFDDLMRIITQTLTIIPSVGGKLGLASQINESIWRKERYDPGSKYTMAWLSRDRFQRILIQILILLTFWEWLPVEIIEEEVLPYFWVFTGGGCLGFGMQK